MTEELYEQRFAAALVSRGTSSDSVYRLASKRIAALRMTGDLLEFGAGTGNLIQVLSDADYGGEITGADILARPASLAGGISWIEADLNDPIPVADGSFDVIISTEVIEHLENPRATFREFNRLLRAGGTLLVTTPNQESIRSYAGLLFGGHFAWFLGESYPAHITALLRMDLERICRETGFESPRFDFSDSGRLPKLPHVRWQDISFNLLGGRLFSDNLALTTRKA